MGEREGDKKKKEKQYEREKEDMIRGNVKEKERE